MRPERAVVDVFVDGVFPLRGAEAPQLGTLSVPDYEGSSRFFTSPGFLGLPHADLRFLSGIQRIARITLMPSHRSLDALVFQLGATH
jgi:hypothetical protein